MTAKRLLISAIVLSLLQIGFLGWIITSRAGLLRAGTEVLLRIQPVDPRDLLRGDYVSLRYDIDRIPAAIITNIPPGASTTEAGPLFVRLKKGTDGFWEAASASFGAPPATPPGPGDADIRGDVAAGWSLDQAAFVDPDYGIDRFYLPEGEGRAIENDMRERPFAMRVAIGRDGTAQIKALMDGDKTLFEEPLY
ncbi:membrane protein [Mesorhizobium sp. L-8-10]|nr:membrane protein [Mesorhizobium sp. L-8-3]BCH33058.1 membrane protein [Mesorhizobium sp. L-8-10]